MCNRTTVSLSKMKMNVPILLPREQEGIELVLVPMSARGKNQREERGIGALTVIIKTSQGN